MDRQAGDVAVGMMMTAFGFVGLLLASGARDDEMYLFGFSLTGFAVLFVAGLIKGHYDRADAHAQAARPATARRDV